MLPPGGGRRWTGTRATPAAGGGRLAAASAYPEVATVKTLCLPTLVMLALLLFIYTCVYTAYTCAALGSACVSAVYTRVAAGFACVPAGYTCLDAVSACVAAIFVAPPELLLLQ